MTLRAFSALAALSGAIVLAGWGAIGTAGWTTGDTSETVYTVASAPPAHEAAPSRDDFNERIAPLGPIAAASVVDASLLSPMAFAPQPQYLLTAAPSIPEPLQKLAPEVTGTVRSAPPPISLEAKRAAEEWKKDGRMLTVAQIPRIKAALRLSPDQEQHWRAVEAELRELARQVEAQNAGGKPVRLTADTAQRLYWTAGPLIMSLREDQKHEARRLAKLMGLDQVAALL
jgi:hypothetical protein